MRLISAISSVPDSTALVLIDLQHGRVRSTAEALAALEETRA